MFLIRRTVCSAGRKPKCGFYWEFLALGWKALTVYETKLSTFYVETIFVKLRIYIYIFCN